MLYQHIQLFLVVFVGFSKCLYIPFLGEAAQRTLGVTNQPDDKTVLAALTQAEVISDVLDTFDVKFLINPFWPETHQRVNLGNKISPDDVDLIPDLELSPPSELLDVTAKTKYTLVLSDPDALSRKNPVKSQMCHWIVTNITLPDFISGNGHTLSLPSLLTSKSEEGIVQLKTYFPPAPPPKTGYHRYVFAFLKSNSDDPSLPKAPKERAHWGYGKVRAGIREWAAENDLTVIAANFFYAQNKKQ